MAEDNNNKNSNDSGNPANYVEKREEILTMLKKGAVFTEELVKENERLRFRVAELESRASDSEDQPTFVQQLMDRINKLEGEKEELYKKFTEVQEENQTFAERHVEIEEENNNLANLYVASYQLHSTLDFDEVVQIITEIVINLIGAEAFAIALVDTKTELVKPVSTEGISADMFPKIHVGEGILGKVIASGEHYINDKIEQSQISSSIDVQQPLAAVPLKIKENVFGVLCIYRFFEQKTSIENVDHELFTLLAGHAATALFSSRLYTDSARKLQTIQGLIQLMAS